MVEQLTHPIPTLVVSRSNIKSSLHCWWVKVLLISLHWHSMAVLFNPHYWWSSTLLYNPHSLVASGSTIYLLCIGGQWQCYLTLLCWLSVAVLFVPPLLVITGISIQWQYCLPPSLVFSSFTYLIKLSHAASFLPANVELRLCFCYSLE